jgi:cellulose biosynthesis protein BcsQ
LQIISFFNNKGGVSKSTSAQFIGELLSNIGYPTLIIDNDGQGTVSIDTYGIPKSSIGMAEILEQPSLIEKALHPTRIKDLWVIPPGKDLEKVAQAWDAKGQLRERVTQIMDIIRIGRFKDVFDACIIDNPPRYLGLSMYSSEYADKIVIPVQSEGGAFKATLRTYVEMKISFPHWDKQDISILITQHNPKRNVANGFVEGFRNWAFAESANYESQNPGKELNLKVFKNVIPDSAEVENIKHDNGNLFLQKSKTDVAKAYIGVTEELMPEITGIANKLAEILKLRKEENIKINIKPNSFKKKENVLEEVMEGEEA